MSEPSPYASCQNLLNGQTISIGEYTLDLISTDTAFPRKALVRFSDELIEMWQNGEYQKNGYTLSVFDITSVGARICVELPHIHVNVPPITLSFSAVAGRKAAGNNITISLSSRKSGAQSVLISSGAGSVVVPPLEQPPTAPACQDMLIGMTTTTPLGNLTLISTVQVFPMSAKVSIAGLEYTIWSGGSQAVPGGTLYASDITVMGARVCLALSASPPAPPPTQPPAQPPGGDWTQPPALEACVLPTLSWNFVEVVRQAVLFVDCNLKNLITQVSWMISAMTAIVPKIIESVTYILSLRWLEDFLDQFFDALDTWLSDKLGIEKDKPFLEELVKKIIGLVAGQIDEAAKSRLQKRK